MEILQAIDWEAWGSETSRLVTSLEQKWIAKFGSQVVNQPDDRRVGESRYTDLF